MKRHAPIQLAVLVSGGGTTLQNLIDRICDKSLNANIALVIASRSGLLGLERAIAARLKTAVIERRHFASVGEFSRQVFDAIDSSGAELVCLAGWLCLLEIPSQWTRRVMNIHPALLPDFGGKGMYGRHVHEAVLKRGDTVSGCTVHFVDDSYDTGPVILQRKCDVRAGDTPDSLAKRVFEEEKVAYPEAIRMFAEGKLP